MEVLLINADKGKYPNLALEKIRIYHEQRGDLVHQDLPMLLGSRRISKCYVSCVFSGNWQPGNEPADWMWWDSDQCQVLIGGTGYDIDARLPTDIEMIIPRINYGFITRGCNRCCKFCVVPKKEGHVYQEAELEQIWDGKAKKVVLMDNNILFAPEVFKATCEYAFANKIEIDFNQGLDHRLLTMEVCELLKRLRHKHYKFAWDNVKDESSVCRAIGMLKAHGIKNSTWYVLVGYDSSWEEDMYRVEALKAMGESVYVMRHDKVRNNRWYLRLAQWTALHAMFKKMSFEEFCQLKGDV